LNYSDHWAKWSLLGDVLRTKLLLMTFYDFLIRHFKKHKKSCFFEIWKKRKIRILEHWSVLVTCWPMISFFFRHYRDLRHIFVLRSILWQWWFLILRALPLACFYLPWNCWFYSWQLLVLLYLVVLTGGNCNSRESWFVSRCESRVTRVTGQKVWPIVISVQDILYSSRLQTLLNLL